jgi:hypothetical protein
MHQTLSDMDHEEAAGDNLRGLRRGRCHDYKWRWCQGLGELGANEAQCEKYGFADDRIAVIHLFEIITSSIFFSKSKATYEVIALFSLNP